MKKFIKIILSIVFVVTLLPTNVKAKGATVVAVEGTYGTCSYTDGYFTEKASDYNASLATLSLSLAGLAFDNGTKFSLPKEMGFEDLESMSSVEDTLSLANASDVVCAHKVIGDKEVVLIIPALIFAQASYYSSIAYIGTSGNHAGLSFVANNLLELAKKYVNKQCNPKSDLKVWIAGYEGLGSVANMVAANIGKAGKLGSFDITNDEIYAYTFGAFNCINEDTVDRTEAATYTNIHNIINPQDMTSYLIPSSWGFYRYGVDEYVIPATYNDYNKEVWARFESYLKSSDPRKYYYEDKTGLHYGSRKFEHIAVGFDENTISELAELNFEDIGWSEIEPIITKSTDEDLCIFVEEFMGEIASALGPRWIYARNYQNVIRIVADIIDGLLYSTMVKKGNIMHALIAIGDKIEKEFSKLTILTVLQDPIMYNKLFADIFRDVLVEYGVEEDEILSLSRSLVTLEPLLVKAIIQMVTLNANDLLTCFYEDNDDYLTLASRPNMYYRWLKTQDAKLNTIDAERLTTLMENAAVTNVSVKVDEGSTGILGIKKYDVSIKLNNKATTKSIKYKTPLFTWNTGNTFASLTKVNDVDIEVVDANGLRTYWHYDGSKTVKK